MFMIGIGKNDAKHFIINSVQILKNYFLGEQGSTDPTRYRIQLLFNFCRRSERWCQKLISLFSKQDQEDSCNWIRREISNTIKIYEEHQGFRQTFPFW